MEEDVFPFETSMDGFLRSNFTSMEHEYILLQSNVGVNDNRVQPIVGVDDNNDATTQQAAVREKFVSPTEKRQGTTTWGIPSSTSNSIGAGLCDAITFLKRNVLPVSCLLVFPSCLFCLRCLSYFSRFVHKNCRSRWYERRNELFGCTGCVN